MCFDRKRLLPLACVGMLIMVMFLLSVHTLTSVYQDIGRHITLGRIIWTTHQIPRTNLFSYTVPDFPFINHHWLGEVMLYLGDRVSGLSGLILFKVIFVALAFGLSVAAAWRRRLAVPAMIVGLVSAFIMVERTDVRPEIFSFVFLAWFLFVLYRYPYTRLMWTLPLVQLLWVNTHIYFFMGPFLFLAWLAGEYARCEGCEGEGCEGAPLSGQKVWHNIFLGLAVTLATLINPWGFAGALYPLRIFDNYGYSIVENQSPLFLRAFGYPSLTSVALAIGIALTALSFFYNRRRMRENVFGGIVMVATAVLALMMIRNFPLFAIVMAPITLKNIDEAGWPPSRQSTLAGGLIILVLLAISIAMGQVYRDAGLGRRFGLDVPAGQQESVDFFRNNGLKGPIFNNFDIGSFLIWRLPQEPVFIDGRPEAYPADFIQNVYIKMQEDAEVWKKYYAQYRINTIFWNEQDITPWSRMFVARIIGDPEWTIRYRSQGILILTKR